MTFAIHEVRDPESQDLLFAELHRALRPSGRLIVTEHLRDGPNLAVYGPAVLHFQTGQTWFDLAAEGGFAFVSDTKLTPFVHRLVWQR